MIQLPDLHSEKTNDCYSVKLQIRGPVRPMSYAFYLTLDGMYVRKCVKEDNFIGIGMHLATAFIKVLEEMEKI